MHLASIPSIEGIHITLTGGNIRHSHFYLRTARHLLPVAAIGGSSKATAGWPVTVSFSSGDTVETDIDGEKMVLRNRASVRRFFEHAKACEGDQILLERTGDRSFRISMAT